jgi:hypothetical protein
LSYKSIYKNYQNSIIPLFYFQFLHKTTPLVMVNSAPVAIFGPAFVGLTPIEQVDSVAFPTSSPFFANICLMGFIASILSKKNQSKNSPKNLYSLFIEKFTMALGAFNEKVALIRAGMPIAHTATKIASCLAIHLVINVMTV